MNILSIDFGSSSIKAAIVRKGRIVSPVARAEFPTRYDGPRVEVNPNGILKALAVVIAELGVAAKKAETIAITVMAPSWVAMDHAGRAITPIVTHQDRRSVEVAEELEERIGKKTFLKIAGTRPIPGGISCTTWAWFLKHEPEVMAKADLCGHLNTFLHRTLTGSRITDPSNASFMGFYNTLTLEGWNDQLIEAVGIKSHRLPQVVGSEEIGGFISASAARRFGLTHGMPMLAGCMDGSAAVILAGNRPGQLVDVCGSTDVLALCTDKPRPHEHLLTRAVGVGKRWVSVSTLAAAGSALDWAHATLFSEMPKEAFFKLVLKVAKRKVGVGFENYLAGSRTDLRQRMGAITGLTLATSREDVLAGITESLSVSSASRLALLRETNSVKVLPEVVMTGGVTSTLSKILHRDWEGEWKFRSEEEATLRGAAAMVEGGKDEG